MAGRGASGTPHSGPTVSWRSVVVLAALGGLFVVVGLVQAQRDAPAVDEVIDLTAGLVAVEHGDLRMNPEHGLLPHVGSALLPALVAEPVVPRTESYRTGDWFDYTEDLIRANDDAGRLDDVVFWFRVMPLLVAAATGLMLFAFTASVLGEVAGLVAAGLWFTTPYVVGIAHLGTLDVWYTAALVSVALAASRTWRVPGPTSTALLGATVGVAMLVRHQAVVLLVVAVVLLAVRARGIRTSLTHLVAVVLVPIALVWVSYRTVDTVPAGGEPRERFDQVISAAAAEGPIERLAVSAPLPPEWRAGVGYLVVTSEPRPAYLLGSAWDGGRPWYFVGSALVKLPITATATVLIGAIGWWRRRQDVGVGAAAVAVVAAFGMEAIFLHVQPLNLGLRLALPLLAVAFVVAGGAAVLLRGRLRAAVLVLVAVAQLGAFAWAHPASLAWTPPPFGDGYRAVSDSSIDLAQATDEVRARHRERPFVAVSLVEPRGVSPVGDLPRIEDRRPSELVGDVAVGATELTVLHRDELAWLRAYCPVEVIADSVLVYRFTAPPDVAPGPATPRSPCDGRVSSR